jgi:hypothetical protein
MKEFKTKNQTNTEIVKESLKNQGEHDGIKCVNIVFQNVSKFLCLSSFGIVNFYIKETQKIISPLKNDVF